MTAVVELEKISRVAPKRFRVEDFYRMMEIGILPEESGWEVINGAVMEKGKITPRNAATVKRLSKVFHQSFREKVLVSARNPIHIDEFNEPEPDIALLKRRDDYYSQNHPIAQDVLLAIEVSDLTVEYDRDIKKPIYAKAGIVEFWIVNLPEETIEVYSQPKNGNYRLARILEKGETVELGSVENLKLQVEEILGL